MVPVLTYHNIGREVRLGLPAVSRSRFRRHMDFLASLGWPLVPAREAASAPARDAIAVTFDDAYLSVWSDALPEMAARGFVGTVFPIAASIGGTNRWDARLALRPLRHLDWHHLRDLVRQGFEIGSHTWSHRDLTRLGEADLKDELARSRLVLEDNLGVPVVSLAYPFGKANPRVMEMAAQVGYTAGFGNSPSGIGMCPGRGAGTSREAAQAGAGAMGLGRMSVYGIDGRFSLRAKLGLGPGRRFELAKNEVIAWLSRGTPLVKR